MPEQGRDKGPGDIEGAPNANTTWLGDSLEPGLATLPQTVKKLS